MRILLSGASGTIGQALKASLDEHHDVWTLVRKPSGAKSIRWDPSRNELDAKSVDGFDAVVHLGGAPIAQRWTTQHKKLIRTSRVGSTTLLATALANAAIKPRVFACASGVGLYGAQASGVLDESSPAGDDFLADVCKEWEASCEAAARAGIRIVQMRTGVVLTPDGGMLGKLLPVFGFGFGGPSGSGTQWLSWVTIRDAVRAYSFAIEHDTLSGPANLVSPHAVTNAEFAHELGRALGRPSFLRVPEFALRLIFGEMADGTILASQHAVPTALQRAGFSFTSPTLKEALHDVLGSSNR